MGRWAVEGRRWWSNVGSGGGALAAGVAAQAAVRSVGHQRWLRRVGNGGALSGWWLRVGGPSGWRHCWWWRIGREALSGWRLHIRRAAAPSDASWHWCQWGVGNGMWAERHWSRALVAGQWSGGTVVRWRVRQQCRYWGIVGMSAAVGQ